MKIIIFAGGTGKRLWPLSRKNSPKQFHKIFGSETTLENSYNTIKEKFNLEDIFISTNVNFVDHVYDTLPNLPKENLIIEPEVRDTGAAVAFAMAKTSNLYPDEPVVIRWQNSLIKNPKKFVKALEDAEQVFKNNDADFVYLAVPSKFANTNVGYIQMGEKISDLKTSNTLYSFEKFTEKPDQETAEKYQSQGNYGWNPGCYITTPRFVMRKLSEVNSEFYSHIRKIIEDFGTDSEEATIKEEFGKLEKISIDYLLWEKLDSDGIKVILSDYDWHYVSTWADLKKALEKDKSSIVQNAKSYNLNSKDLLIYNFEDEKAIATVGLENIAIINTPDALLVVNKDKAGDVKALLEDLPEELT